MTREVTDGDGTVWSCVQAFAGLGDGAAKAKAKAALTARIGGVHVVCTPNGGARSVRVELPEAWESEMPDDQLLAAIAAQRAQDGQQPGDTA